MELQFGLKNKSDWANSFAPVWADPAINNVKINQRRLSQGSRQKENAETSMKYVSVNLNSSK